MVYLNEIMKTRESYYLATENPNKWLYCFLFKIAIPDGDYLEENKLCFLGYKGLSADDNELDICVSKNGKINYTTSVPLFIGVHLSDKGGKYNEKVSQFYGKLTDNKTKYVFSLCFPWLKERFSKDVDEMCADKNLYKYLIGKKVDGDIPNIINTDNPTIFDLIIYKKALELDKIIHIDQNSIVDNIIHMLNNFSNAIRRITVDRYAKQSGIKIEKEYDVQDILFSFFKFYFNDTVRENPLKKRAGSNSIIDICFPDRKIYIEVKMLKDKDDDEKKIIDELKKDMFDYNQEEVENLIIFVYDPFKKIKDKDNFTEFEKQNNGFKCNVVIQ